MSKRRNTYIVYVLLFLTMLAPITLIAESSSLGSNNKVFAKWDWKDAEISSVIEHLSIVSGVNLVLDPQVKGKINLTMRKQTWSEVFKVVCKMNSLTYEKMDSYIYVMRESDHLSKMMTEVQNKKTLENIEELEKVIIKLENTTAAEMVAPVKALLSTRGSAITVEHTNSLIISELSKNLPEVRAYIKKLDMELLQISISAKIIEVNSDIRNDIGVQWGFFDGKGGEVSHMTPDASKRGKGIIAGAFERATFGVLDEQGFSVALEYLFTEANSEIVSEPQITTIENKQAKIFAGHKIPLSNVDYAGNTKITMIDAGTELIVTPTITGAGNIQMDLKPTKKSYTMTPDGPVISEQGAETNVVVKDGETIVIAGLTSDEDIASEAGIPFLKDIPILGFLFKKSSKKVDKKDLVIFVTPHIIRRTGLDVMQDKEIEESKEEKENFKVEEE